MAKQEVEAYPPGTITYEKAPSGAPVPPTPMEILSRAVSQGASIDVLEKLMGLQERWEANEARKAFEKAMAAASAEMPMLVKNRSVGYESKKSGSSTSYKHEDLAEVVGAVGPVLSKHGLSHRFETSNEPGKAISVTCVISHELGHSIRNMMMAPPDISGQKNAIQAIGSTVTYLSRYALKAALGLAAAHDDDGNNSGSKEPVAGPDAMRQPVARPTQQGTGSAQSAAPPAPTDSSPAGTPTGNPKLTIQEVMALEKEARAAAGFGSVAFQAFWKRLLTLNQREVIKGLGEELRRTMSEADAEIMKAEAVAVDPATGEVTR